MQFVKEVALSSVRRVDEERLAEMALPLPVSRLNRWNVAWMVQVRRLRREITGCVIISHCVLDILELGVTVTALIASSPDSPRISGAERTLVSLYWKVRVLIVSLFEAAIINASPLTLSTFLIMLVAEPVTSYWTASAKQSVFVSTG